MKKIIFYNVSMKSNISKCKYESNDMSLPVTETKVYYPINVLLEKTLQPGDEIRAILLAKKDELGNYRSNINVCVEELMTTAEKSGASVEYKILYTDFDESQFVHDKLTLDIVDEFEENAHIMADITYGPKDLPIVLFVALSFGEKFFNLEIDNIIYGQATFVDGKPSNTKICDMIPLYYLNSVTNAIKCDNPGKAKEMLKSLLSI